MFHSIPKSGVKGSVNYGGISVLSLLGKVYSKIVTACLKRDSGEEHGRSQRVRGCVGKNFSLRQVVGKVLEKRKTYVTFRN